MKYIIPAIITFLAIGAQASKTYLYQTVSQTNIAVCANIIEISVQDSGAHFDPEKQVNDFVQVKHISGTTISLKHSHSERQHDSDIAAHALEVYKDSNVTAVLERNSDNQYPRPTLAEGFSTMDLSNSQYGMSCSYKLIPK